MLKRFLSLLVCLGQLVAFAAAAPDTPYPAGTLVLYHMQEARVQRLIDLMYEGVMRGETKISLPPGTRYDDTTLAWTILTDEFPELVHLNNQGSIAYYQDAPEYAISVHLQYTMTMEEFSVAYGQMMDAAQGMVAAAYGTDYERELLLHDALAGRVTYTADQSSRSTSTAYGALVQGAALCEGYAHALTLLCRLSGIPCSMVIGMADSGSATSLHAWNAVEIGGELLITDCTFNDRDEDGLPVHWYFNLPAQETGATYQPYTQLQLGTSDKWTYARQSGGYIASAADMQPVFDAQLARMRATGMPMELKAADSALFHQLVNSLEMLMTNSAYEVGTMNYSTSYALRSITITEERQ